MHGERHRFVRRLLHEGARDGSLRPVADPVVAARALFGAVVASGLPDVHTAGTLPTEHLGRHITDIVLAASNSGGDGSGRPVGRARRHSCTVLKASAVGSSLAAGDDSDRQWTASEFFGKAGTDLGNGDARVRACLRSSIRCESYPVVVGTAANGRRRG